MSFLLHMFLLRLAYILRVATYDVRLTKPSHTLLKDALGVKKGIGEDLKCSGT